MGGAISAGKDNNELVEKLIRVKCLRSPHIQRVFRAVDRGDYFLPAERENAYTDLAWKSGLLHLSAPCIYCDVMEALKLRPGMSFLNLGSGTGYLSTMAGLILGTEGINHGVELHPFVVRYANERLYDFVQNSCAIDELDFCEPKFVVGNCLCLPPTLQLYDRVYCGAACPKEHETYFKKLIKVGGILVMPLDEYLLRIKRTSEDTWVTQKLLHVSFSTLVTPTNFERVDLPDAEPPALQSLCRSTIRKVLRNAIAHEQPEILESLMKYDTNKVKRKPNQTRTKTFCISIEDENSDSEDLNNIHNLDLESGSREMNALLRLVMSMGSRQGNVLISDLTEARGAVFHGDEEITSSEDDESGLSDFDTSSSDNNAHSSTSDFENRTSDFENNRTSEFENNRTSDFENNRTFDNDRSNLESHSVDVNISSNKNDDLDKMGPSTSDETAESCNPKEQSSAPENTIPGKIKRNDKNDREENPTKRKTDSGIGEDNSAKAFNGSSSSNDTSDLMDTNSSDENMDKPKFTKEEKESDSDTWCPRKRPLPNDDESASDRGDSTDSECEERSGNRSKVKRKSPPRPHPYDVNRKKLSMILKQKVFSLSLPMPLKKFVNMNRDFSS